MGGKQISEYRKRGNIDYYKEYVVIEGKGPGLNGHTFPDGYKDNSIFAITSASQLMYKADLEESGFVPLCTFESRYASGNKLVLWLRAKGQSMELTSDKKLKKEAAKVA